MIVVQSPSFILNPNVSAGLGSCSALRSTCCPPREPRSGFLRLHQAALRRPISSYTHISVIENESF